VGLVLLLALLVGYHTYRAEPNRFFVLEEEKAEDDGEGADCKEGEECEGEAEEYKRPEWGTRWIRPGANAQAPLATGRYKGMYNEAPLNHIGIINPYHDLPYVSQRGLPAIRRRYDVGKGWYEPESYSGDGKAVFAPNTAMRDLNVMKEYGLTNDREYVKRREHIQQQQLDPYAPVVRDPPPGELTGWNSPSKMCRDVTTRVAGLNNEGWTELNTLRCCNYLCDKDQWKALKNGDLVWGMGSNNRYSSAITTQNTVKLMDGSEKYLCRSCAWQREPTYNQLGRMLTKMEGHIPTFNLTNSTNSTEPEGDEGDEGEEDEAEE